MHQYVQLNKLHKDDVYVCAIQPGCLSNTFFSSNRALKAVGLLKFGFWLIRG